MALKKIVSNKYLQPVLHILFWGMLIFSPYLFRNTQEPWQGLNDWQYRTMVFKILLAVMFYFNIYFLYPVIYKKRGIWLYLLSVIITISILMAVSYVVDRMILDLFKDFERGRGRGGRGWRGRRHMPTFVWIDIIWNMILPYLFIVGMSFSYRMIIDNARQEKIRKEKETENLKTELSFLRSQVSPHFIFNILNNMVSLARKKSDLLEPSLIRLSSLIRYMLYENDDEKVSLEREVEYLNNYIDLQLLRFGDDISITFNPQGNLGGYVIEPMLLTAFVENAFKHGVGMVADPHIDITLNVNGETNWLDFKVMNTIAPQQDSKDKSSGIGLINVKRRLELLYGDDYSLDIMQTETLFIVDLKIKLK